MNALFVARSHASEKSLIERAIAEHGATRVLLAAAAAILRRRPAPRPRPPDAYALGNHLRRDVGLPPEPEAADYRNFRF